MAQFILFVVRSIFTLLLMLEVSTMEHEVVISSKQKAISFHMGPLNGS